MKRVLAASTVAAAVLVITSAVNAGVLPEQKCQARRANAAGKYAECAQKALGKLSLSGDLNAYNAAGGKCVTKYDATWDRLQGEATGSGATCDNPRFVDNGDGTVTDRLTALQWETKDNLDNSPNPADPHDADNSYTWSAPSGTAADGTAFMSFLASLNSGGCFAGQCDWRLPTRDELWTTLSPPFPACATPPCIDLIFGPTAESFYWSSTTFAGFPFFAWVAPFHFGGVNFGSKDGGDFVRAVRGGL